MVMVIAADSLAKVSTRLRNIFLFGIANLDVVSPRGMETREISPCFITITNPRSRLAYHPIRRLNLMHAICESLHLFGDSNKVDDYPFVSMQQFSDDETTLHGAYGPRIASALPSILNILRNDPDSRQAVIPIFESSDLNCGSKDVPCTATIQFTIRRGVLNCHVNMRSNDFVWGFPYDVFQFTMMQEVIANTLGYELGYYHHSTMSMHTYKHHYDFLERIGVFEPAEFSVDYVAGEMQWLFKSFVSLFGNRDDFRAESLIANDIKPPFTELLRNEHKYRDELQVPQLSDDSQWAQPFVKRWYNG